MASARTYKSFPEIRRPSARTVDVAVERPYREAIFTPWLSRHWRGCRQAFTIGLSFRSGARRLTARRRSITPLSGGRTRRQSLPLLYAQAAAEAGRGSRSDPETGCVPAADRRLDHSANTQVTRDEGDSRFQRGGLALWRAGGFLPLPPRRMRARLFPRQRRVRRIRCLAWPPATRSGQCHVADGAPIMTLDVRFRKPLDPPCARHRAVAGLAPRRPLRQTQCGAARRDRDRPDAECLARTACADCLRRAGRTAPR